MAANKQQGQSFGLFLIGMTVLCSGIAWVGSGLGKVALIAGLVIVAVSLAKGFGLKAEEGRVALGSQPAAMKLIGVLVTVIGWAIALFGLHVTKALGGRFVITIVGLVIACIGPLVILPAACNKNAIWKS